MPNNTTIVLQIKGSKKNCNALKNAVLGEDKGEDTSFLDFNKIVPIPPELEGTRSPMNIITQEEYDEQERKLASGAIDKNSIFFSRSLTQELSDKYREDFGADNWYEWCLINWGTKWGAYDFNGDWVGSNVMTFYTAWSPPIPIIEKLSAMFPTVKITMWFADEGGSWCGSHIYKNGKIVDKHEFDYNDPKFNNMYFEITGTDLEAAQREYEEERAKEEREELEIQRDEI